MTVNSSDELAGLVADPLIGSLTGAVSLGVLALVPTNVFPRDRDDSVTKWVYRLDAACPGSKEEVSTRRRCSRVYGPRGLGL